ncbi:MAG: dockerin type I repeat-containing protein [Clostridiales bacterium]|nr:dockerin type I repeat-containing protein [Clostridiales bacterium]
MKKAIKYFSVLILCVSLTLSSYITAFSETLPAPTWVSIVTNDDSTKTIVISTPDYMLDNIDYYEYSFDGGSTWTKLLTVGETELPVSQTTEFALRYTKSNATSEAYTATVAVSSSTAITSSGTGITLLIPYDSEIPTDVTLAAYEIVDGSEYSSAASFLTSNRPFAMYSVKIMRNNREYSTDAEKTWLFPIGSLDADYAVLYHIDSDGTMTKIDATVELNALYCTTSLTGIFAVVEDKSYCKGDINGDAAVTATDARIALRVSARLETVNDTELTAGDINGDGQISASDARQILQASAKLITLE